MIKAIPPALWTVFLVGCVVSAPAEEYSWTLRAPQEVDHAPHSRLTFTVETSLRDGRPISEVPYVWTVDWVGLHGVEHQGHSYREESIRVKGESGYAVLRIFAHAGYDRLVEVARATVRVHRRESPAS